MSSAIQTVYRTGLADASRKPAKIQSKLKGKQLPVIIQGIEIIVGPGQAYILKKLLEADGEIVAVKDLEGGPIKAPLSVTLEKIRKKLDQVSEKNGEIGLSIANARNVGYKLIVTHR